MLAFDPRAFGTRPSTPSTTPQIRHCGDMRSVSSGDWCPWTGTRYPRTRSISWCLA